MESILLKVINNYLDRMMVGNKSYFNIQGVWEKVQEILKDVENFVESFEKEIHCYVALH